MNHDIQVERHGVRLRPVRIEDARFIYQLRWEPSLSQYIGDTDQNPEAQVLWLERYMQREGDYYFIIETSEGKRVGTIAIYEADGDRAEWGRWVIMPGQPVAPGSSWLIYYVAFECLGLKEVYCRTVEDNVKVVSFHDHCGLRRIGVEKNGVTIKGESKNLIVHAAGTDDWPAIQSRLALSVKMAQRLIEGANP